jgi:5S rRNA maturation endonuclease (ribonuclease M5)
MNRARQRRATIKLKQTSAFKERRENAFISFLGDFVLELNQLSADGWATLIEGKRDERALRRLGYAGPVVQASEQGRGASAAASRYRGVVILTDLDKEGGRLAARYSRVLAHEGIRVSTAQRKRLLVASRGVFRHIENLGRFSEQGPA